MFRLQSSLIGFALLAFCMLPSAVLGQSCPCTIWPPSATPTLADSGDSNSGEFGVKFRSDVNGTITGIRFYKATTNTGTHIANLWSSTGTKLASATFSSETASGWQQVNFSTPVSITAGTTYVASYFTSTGHYSFNNGLLTSAVDNPPLHALANGTDGPNGVFTYGTSSAFPTSTYNASYYWVDVVFSTTQQTHDPVVSSVSPANGAALVSTTTAITATFSKAIDPTTINSNTFQLVDSSNNIISASVAYNSSTLTATLQPNVALLSATNYTATVKGGTTEPTVKDTSGNSMAANFSWSFGTANPPGTCPCTIWASTATPGTTDSGDSSSGEFGVRFRSDLSGYILGLRFYKSSANTGTHFGNVWSNSGTLLGSAMFTAESSSGWQQVNFPNPVPVTAGTTYVASYFSPSGHYSYDGAFFTNSGIDNPPLHALLNGLDGSNGVFSLGTTSSFPTSSFNASNYWVDVVFSTTIPGQPPTITSFTPPDGASGVSVSSAVTVTFNKAIDPTTITSSTFQLLDPSGTPVAATLSYDSSTLRATLQPSAALAVSAMYTAVVRGGTTDPRIKDASGTPLAANTVWSFATGSSSTPPVILSVTPGSGQIGVSGTTSVSVTFSESIDPTTLTTSTFQLIDASNNVVGASISYNSTTFTAVLQPTSPLNGLATYTAVVRGGTTDPRVKDVSGNALPSTVSWLFTTATPPPPPPSCPCSIWRSTNAPTVADSGESASLEVGVKFRADSDGLITGIRFYKSVANTGTHIGNLWTSTGTLLASATFTGESSSGWQQVMFSSPIAITANTVYVASYFTTAGHYAMDQGTFGTAGVDNAPLHALASGASGGNGVFQYNATSKFPTQSYNGSNYWVDVIYLFNNSTTPPSITSTSPANNATGVSIGSTVSATFNEPLDTSTVNSTTLQVVDSSGNTVSGVVTYVSSSATILFSPTTDLLSQTTYTATVSGTVRDTFGNALGSNLVWSFTTTAAPANTGPGGPILVVSSAQNPFTRYLGEILQNEGMNEYTVQDIATVTPATLAARDIVILGDMQLTATQVSMFTSWVNTGGNLIAMHPDKQLAGLLGLSAGSATLSNAYLLVNTTMPPGAGILGQTMQFHGPGDLYTLAGSTALATFYSDAFTPTTFPAVTWIRSGAGQAAAFTYDLAKSVVLTRQGNPAWSGQWRDGYIDPVLTTSGQIRPDDLFYGPASFDPQPNWMDFSKITIPHADEQQRLLANLIQQMNQAKKPLPRFWYFPSGFKAVVIMTGDDHNNGGTAGRFDQYLNDSPAGCSVADWTCVRATSYIWTNTPIPNYLNYVSQGFEIANHSDNNPSCTNWTPSQFDAAITSQLAQIASNYPGLPVSKTNRTHCVLWSDYDSEPQILLNHGIRFDTTYYYWPPPWVNGQSGLFTGSGMPMRYTDRSGNIFDVYQATTQIPDEDTWDYTPAIDVLLDDAIGPLGFYGAFTMNMHTDQVQSTGSDIIVAEAQARGVPIVSSLQMLTWLDGRNSSSFGSIAWNGSLLTFTVTAGTGARNLRAMLPLATTAGSLSKLTLNGSPISFTTQTVKGVQYAMFAASTGSYQATYGAGGAFAISGVISGSAAGGTAVALSGGWNAQVTTDAAGNYLFTGLVNGGYTVTPSRTGFLFSPTSQSATVSNGNITSLNFTSTVSPTFKISGNIGGAGGSGTLVTLGGTASGTTISDSLGNYTFTGLYNGTYTVTPTHAGYTFTPSSQTVSINGANVAANFTSASVTPTPIAIDTMVFTDAGSGSKIISPSFSTAAGNELLLAFVAADNPGSGTNTSVSSMTGAGLTWQLVQRTNVQLGTAEIWRAFAVGTLTNVSVTAQLSVTVASANLTVISVTGADYSGTNGSGAIGAIGTANSSSGAPTASLVTTRNNSLVLGVGNDWDQAVARIPGANQSLIHQYLTANGDTDWVQRQNSTSPLSGTSVTINDTSPTTDRYNLSIVEVLPIAGTSSSPTYAISGNISGAGASGTTVALSGAASTTVTSDTSGNFSFTGLANGSYTVTPQRAGFAFAPAAQNVSVNSADVTGLSFTSATNVVSVSSVALTPNSVTGGTPSSGTVTLSGPAPTGGAIVSLSDNSSAAQTPASVTIAAGSTSATFSTTTSAVGSVTNVTVTATYNGTSAQGSLTINPPRLTLLSLNPTTVTGGTSSTGTVTLSGPAPTGGASVSLSDNSSAAQTPATVTIVAGATSASFTVTTSAVSSVTNVAVTGTYNATSAQASLTVNPAQLTSLSLSPTTVTGGASSTGTVQLNGPAPIGGASITLSDNSSFASVPANVSVAAGASRATFTVSTTAVTSSTTAVVSAAYGGTTRQATLTINPVTLSSLGLSPSSIVGGNSSTGTVTLTGPAPAGGIVVGLSDNSAVAQTPVSVTVAAGSRTATFTITTVGVSSSTGVTITATYGVSRSATLTVNPASLASLTLSPSTVVGGATSTGTVTLNGLPPSGGAVVSLSSSNTSVAQVASSVTIPAGSRNATFTVSTSPVHGTSARISGTYRGTTLRATLTVQ